jgi:hypothetical protein
MSVVEVRLSLAPWQIRYLRETAKAQGISMSDLMRTMILTHKMNADDTSKEARTEDENSQ